MVLEFGFCDYLFLIYHLQRKFELGGVRLKEVALGCGLVMDLDVKALVPWRLRVLKNRISCYASAAIQYLLI